MNRKKFIKNGIVAGIIGTVSPNILKAKESCSKPKTSQKIVGFNHIPNKGGDIINTKINNMKTVIHRANSRGSADHGWLKVNHSFSFANYYNPDRMNFGVIRVLNDDQIAGGQGFPTHPHQNMEIITIPMEGDLAHKDSIGNTSVIKEGDIQVMSAGKGVYHSEFNNNPDKSIKLFQIWLLPNKENVKPRYDQIKIGDLVKKNEFSQILSPNSEDQGVWIHQDAWFHMGNFDSNKEETYSFKKKSNGVYAMVIEGEVEIEGQKLGKRDAMGIWDTDKLHFKSNTDSKVLLLDVPMEI